jgi:GNAT superfamily N-acetyltransferase
VNPRSVEQSIEIRDLDLRDLAAFAVLRRRIAGQNQFSLPAIADLRAEGESVAVQVARTLADPAQKRIVALRDGGLVGFVSAYREGNAAQLEIGVDAAWIGLGVGRQLMAATEAWARAAGLARLELNVVPANLRAIALYKRCGFNVDRIANGAGSELHHMSKILD